MPVIDVVDQNEVEFVEEVLEISECLMSTLDEMSEERKLDMDMVFPAFVTAIRTSLEEQVLDQAAKIRYVELMLGDLQDELNRLCGRQKHMDH